jgi:AcrR family transcriptional regulator
MTAELLEIARRHLGAQGAAALSLRAIAREAGMVSSAIYRYFPSRDELLTALIVRAYGDLADVVEVAEAKVKRSDFFGRWRSASRAIRAWALANPHDYGLLYGTPVPGYVAPTETIEPVVRTSTVFMRILADAHTADRLAPATISKSARAAVAPVAAIFPAPAAAHIANGVFAWSSVFGLVSFELFGHFNNVIADPDAFFDFQIDNIAKSVIGLRSSVSQT